jgi:hypothetical protein
LAIAYREYNRLGMESALKLAQQRLHVFLPLVWRGS